MRRYALVGKNIQHSLSPKIYEKLILGEFTYDLIDVESVDKLPTLKNLQDKYCGINITSPYKEHYFDRHLCVDVPVNISAINCISFSDKIIRMTNTDYPAMRRVLAVHILSRFKVDKICILGNGVMSQLTQHLLDEIGRTYLVISRRSHGDLNAYDYGKLISKGDEFTLLINTCAREFNFVASIHKQTIFWDMNYEMPHKHALSGLCHYLDGYDLLYEQALEATRFWNEVA